MADLGVYIHFPFCRHVCPYCDFAVAVAPRDGLPHEAYLDAISRELDDRAAGFAGRDLVSIYFGGGTPSLWRPDCLAAAIARVRDRLGGAAPPLEITLEANPADCTPDTMAAWRAAGIDRLSIGVQSYDPRALAVLGRDHRMGDGAAALAAAVAAGFRSVSADIIFGTPTRAPEAAPAAGATDAADAPDDAPLDPSVAAAAGSGVDHLSVYELTIEPRTAFGRAARAGTLQPLDDNLLAATYAAIHAGLEARGFEHYEVSSYARPGRRAVHNGLYWRGAEFLGLGNGAASFQLLPGGGGQRWKNEQSVKRYLALAEAAVPGAGANPERRVAERDPLSPVAVATDRLWLGMRTSDGVPLAALADRPGVADWLLARGLALQGPGPGAPGEVWLRPTLRGFLHADAVAQRLVDAAPADPLH